MHILFGSVRSGENFHILLWLLKDICWVMDLRLLGTLMIVPTVGMAVYIAWKLRDELGELLHSLAVVFWILANGIWMLGEFFQDDRTRPISSVLFLAGLLCIAWFYGIISPREKRKAQQAGVLHGGTPQQEA